TASTPSAPDDSMVKTEEEKQMLVLVEPDFLQHRLSLTQVIQISEPDLYKALCNVYSFSQGTMEGEGATWLGAVCLAYRCNWERSPAKQRPGSQPGPELSVTQREVLEVKLLMLLDVLHVWQEFGKHISALTKVIAKRPYKRQQERHELPFCTAGTSGSRVRVEEDGTGPWQVWERQIQQFNRVSPATAAAVAEAHPSPSLLVQAYEECSDDERLLLLSDIPVKSDISGQDCRLGTDLPTTSTSSTDPDLVLDLMA
uniref:ERCC4 domain-containing protein n=1 Tax=Anas zonorhyncha TaxID=75864 RepID=A0A8B9UEA5_9AVES